MTIVAALFYVLTFHRVWSWLLLVLLGAAFGGLMVVRKKRKHWLILIPAFFFIGLTNCFVAPVYNALFLAAFGTDGTAVITQSTETDASLNDQPILAYDGVLRTADGQDVTIQFDTMSASIYPITDDTRLPPEGERFAVRYIPGFPRNFAIMRDLSPYGIELRIRKDLKPVQKAANQLAASPDNPTFREEYRTALTVFIAQHRNNAPAAMIQDCQQKLDMLGHAH